MWRHLALIKAFSCSTQLRLKFILLINVKMPTTVGILTFISKINCRLWCYEPELSVYFGYISIYEQFEFYAQLSHSVYPSVCRTDGYGTDRRLQEHALFRAKNVLYSFSSKTVRFECIVISALHVHLLSSKTP